MRLTVKLTKDQVVAILESHIEKELGRKVKHTQINVQEVSVGLRNETQYAFKGIDVDVE
jgi:hypothetical protein